MKVHELMEALKALDPELPVMVRGYEGGVNDVEQIDHVFYKKDANKGASYYGRHELIDKDDHLAVRKGKAAVELCGSNSSQRFKRREKSLW